MSVRISYYSYNQTGPKTVKATYSPKESLPTPDKQDTNLSFRVQTEPTIAHLAAFFGAFLDVFRSFDAPAQPRFSAPQQKSPSSSDTKFKFAHAERAREADMVMQTLLALFYFDGPFVVSFTERAQPPAQPVPPSPRLTVKNAPRETYPAASSGPSWHHLPSRAGREASGIPLFSRRTTDGTVAAAPQEHRPSEPVVTEASERIATEPRVAADERTELAETPTATTETQLGEASRPAATEHPLAPLAYSYQAYEQALNVDRDLNRRRAEYVQARSDHEDHASKSAEEARRSAEEAKGLAEEAARVQDAAKAENLRNDAAKLNVRAKEFDDAAQAHRAQAIEFTKKIADVDDQIDMLTPPAA